MTRTSNSNNKLTKSQEKTVKKLVRAQDLIKKYLMFNGQETQTKWIPPLDYAEEHTNSAAQARVLRLAKILLNQCYYKIANVKGIPDLFMKRLDEYDKYIIAHTTIGLNRSADGKYTQNESLPLVVPMIFTQKKYKSDEIKFPPSQPKISVTHEDGKTEYITVDHDMSYRMLVVLQYVGSFQVPFTDECVEYILYDKHREFLDHMIKQVEGLLDKTSYGQIDKDKISRDLEYTVMKTNMNYSLPYLDSYVANPPSVRS